MFMLTAGRSRLRRTRGTKIFDLPKLCVSSLPFACACVVGVLTAQACAYGVAKTRLKSRQVHVIVHCKFTKQKHFFFFLSAGMQKAQESVQRRLALTKHFDICICAYPDNACIDLFLITLGQLCVQFMCLGEILTC